MPDAIIGNNVMKLKAVPSAIIRATSTPHAPAHINPIIRNLRTTDIFIFLFLSLYTFFSCFFMKAKIANLSDCAKSKSGPAGTLPPGLMILV